MVVFSYFNRVFNMPNINIFNTPWNFDIVFNIHYSFQHTLKFSTCCFNIVFNTYYSFQYALKFSTCFSTHLEIFNIVLNLHYSFQHALKCSTCCFNIVLNLHYSYSFQYALKFSTHFFNMCYSFQNMLKCSTCFFTVFRTCWKFQHAFLQFSEHAENFNMLFYSFQHSFSICFQNVLQISTHSDIFNMLSNMKIWNIYSQIVIEPSRNIWKILVRTQYKC